VFVVLLAGAAVAFGSTAWAVDDPADPTGAAVEGTVDLVTGDEAVDVLVTGRDLQEVAADAGLPPQELIAEFRADESLFLVDSGMVGYADTGDHDAAEHGEAVADAPGGAAAELAVPPGVDVAALSSRPTSAKTIYIDVDGHVMVNEPLWGAFGTQNSAPFDLDGVPGLSSAESAVVFEVWRRVSEDYLPFDVNVTTVDPGVEALRKTSPADAAFGQRVVVTPTNFMGPGILGVALLNIFDFSRDVPVYAFTDTPSSRATKSVAEAVAHEVGHTFGLTHDADVTTTIDYYAGHGAWAPIMGLPVSPARPVTQWSRGEYAVANNAQDDLSIIAADVGYRPDDHGDTTATATPIPATSTTAGVIGRSGDCDVFTVSVGAGDLSATIRPPAGAAPWSNLLARLTVRNGSGVVVGTATPSVPSSWAATVNAVVPAGRYTLAVEPVAWLTPSTGFSSYGSLGAYELVVGATDAGTQAPPTVATSCRAATFTAVPPNRLADTRGATPGPFGRIGASRQIAIQVTGRAGIPTGAVAAVLNVTVDRASTAGFATVHPCLPEVPGASTLNFGVGAPVPNTTIAALSSTGLVCIWTSAEADVLVDVTGWFGTSGSSRFTPVGPDRVVDTRRGFGGTTVPPGGVLEVDLTGEAPAGSTAVALNVTADRASGDGFLTVYPCGTTAPITSTVNYGARRPRPNNTIVGIASGRVCIANARSSTDVLVDVTGAFGPSGRAYLPTPPARVLDTRRGSSSTPPLLRGTTVDYSVSGPALSGVAPSAAFVNVTAPSPSVAGFVTTFDCGPRPDTSTLNQEAGQDVANGANVPVSGLTSCAWLSDGGHLIVDVNGWWVP
jgi:hypothetical protein